MVENHNKFSQEGSHDMEGLPKVTKSYSEDVLAEGIQLFNEGRYIEAIEVFSYYSKTGNLLSRKYLARCYHRLQQYDVAYKHFKYLYDHSTDIYKDYSASMIAAIEIISGNYGKAVKILKSLPPTARNQINLSLIYWKRYKVEKDEFSIREALRILNKLDMSVLSANMVATVQQLKGLIYHAQKEYRLSESYYKQAFTIAVDDISRGQILNDLASLYIETKNYDEAEKYLNQARDLVLNKSELEEAFNHKWFGILNIKRRQYEAAKEHLTKAVKVIREKDLLREVAGIVFLLAELSREEGFYKAADHYAEGIALEKLLQEVKDSDEKIVNFYFSIFFSNHYNDSSSGR